MNKKEMLKLIEELEGRIAETKKAIETTKDGKVWEVANDFQLTLMRFAKRFPQTFLADLNGF